MPPPVFIVLEPFNHIFFVIEEADRRGFDVVVFHTLARPDSALPTDPWAKVTTSHQLTSWSDTDANMKSVIDVCAGRDVVGVYAAAEPTLLLEARIREEYGLKGHTAAEVRNFLNKKWVRSRLRENGLTGLSFVDETDFDAMENWPEGKSFFFKPVNGGGSASVKRCTSYADLQNALSNWQAFEDVHFGPLREYLKGGAGVFLEEAAEGELLSVEGITVDGDYHPFTLASRAVLKRDIAVEMGLTVPYEHPLKERIFEKVRQFHAAVGYRHGISHVEIIVTDAGEIELVELNIRFMGWDSLRAVNIAFDVRMEEILVDMALGRMPEIAAFRKPRQVSALHYFLAPSGAEVFHELSIASSELAFEKSLKSPGEALKTTDNQMDHIGYFIVTAPTHDDVMKKVLQIRRDTTFNGAPLGEDNNNVIICR
ncbi:MAG: ATP-grasp domain-containing protein [Rhodobacter sp.]|nr:ATP-grasp domain-containing protein [Rhodobacter sp.]